MFCASTHVVMANQNEQNDSAYLVTHDQIMLYYTLGSVILCVHQALGAIGTVRVRCDPGHMYPYQLSSSTTAVPASAEFSASPWHSARPLRVLLLSRPINMAAGPARPRAWPSCVWLWREWGCRGLSPRCPGGEGESVIEWDFVEGVRPSQKICLSFLRHLAPRPSLWSFHSI